MTSVSQILNDFNRFGPGHSLSWDQNHNNTLETWQTLLFYCTILKFVVKLGKCTPLRGFAYDLRISCCCMCVLLPNQPIYVCFFLLLLNNCDGFEAAGSQSLPQTIKHIWQLHNFMVLFGKIQIVGEFENRSLSNDLHTFPIQA